jgi:hypothetical protein
VIETTEDHVLDCSVTVSVPDDTKMSPLQDPTGTVIVVDPEPPVTVYVQLPVTASAPVTDALQISM